MPIPGLDPDKCRVRNRRAAVRDGVEGVPVRFLRDEDPLGFEAAARELGGEAPAHTFASSGTLPKSDADALALIHALGGRNSQGEALTADDVWIHYAEAANSNFIGDRFMFLDRSTLKNIAKDAAKGVAFMNSHRTGGLSHPSELPFGRTFAGRYEEYTDANGERQCRALLGFYMLRGVRPNGDGGPSTDDLHAGIQAGTVFDVSVGLYGGNLICDVCGHDVYGYDPDEDERCAHLPGTHYSMNKEERAAQKARGVPDGKCSATLCDSRMGEVSAVYDGAVPGAGFRKALSLCRDGRLDAETLGQCRHAFASLVSRRDFATGKGEPASLSVDELAAALQTLWGESEKGDEPDADDILFSDRPTLPVNPETEPDPAPAAESFEHQLERAHAALEGCIDRADGYQRLSAGRRAQLEATLARGHAVLEKHQPESSGDRAARLQQLQIRNLRIRAGLPGE